MTWADDMDAAEGDGVPLDHMAVAIELEVVGGGTIPRIECRPRESGMNWSDAHVLL